MSFGWCLDAVEVDDELWDPAWGENVPHAGLGVGNMPWGKVEMLQAVLGELHSAAATLDSHCVVDLVQL